MFNPLLLIDGYKLDHRRQYPKGTTKVYSNWTPRASRTGETSVVFFGLQYFLQRYLMDEFYSGFFRLPLSKVLDEYKRVVDAYLGPNEVGTSHIRNLWQLGYLPLKFNAIPEGTSVPLRVPMLTVENTHPEFFWLPNYIETLMSSVLWIPCTSATTARGYRRILEFGAKQTGSPVEFIDWQAHDFSMRGMENPDAAALSGAAHLLYFKGTDTIPAIGLVEQFYKIGPASGIIGGSVAATEHSVMCAGGQEDELETFNRIITEVYPGGIVSIVSDTWDLWNVLTVTLPALKDKIMAREGKVVIRPDSGDPVKIICGDPTAPDGTPAHKGVIQLLWDTFGGTATATSHRLLDSHVGAIYGDSITQERATQILGMLARKGFAAANIVFGVGSYTYQYVTRDTHGFAMKATWVEINGEGKAIFKKPVTDNGEKNSAKGRLSVMYGNRGQLELINEASPLLEASSLLTPVWQDGKFIRMSDFEEIRAIAMQGVTPR